MKPTPPKIPLTERQSQIMYLVQQGSSNKDVARKLGITEGTVRQHLQEIYRRLNVTNRTMASQVQRQTQDESLFLTKEPTQKNRTAVPTFPRFTVSMHSVSIVRVSVLASEVLVNTLGSRGFARLHHMLLNVCEQESHRFDAVMQGVPEGLILLFGIPHLRQDDPERAALCAWRMDARTRRLWQEELDISEFPVRICVVSGGLVVNTHGEKTTLHGDLLSSQPCESASERCREGGRLCLSQTTRQAVHALQAYYGPLPTSLLDASNAQLPKEWEGERGGGNNVKLPFFGRASEWETLRNHKESLLQGESQAMLLLGEAGFGKTRLVKMFQEEVLLQDPGLRWLDSGCRSSAQRFLFHPFLPVLEALAGCHDVGESPHSRRERLKQWIDSQSASQARLGHELLALHDAPAVPLTPEQLTNAADFMAGVLGDGTDTILFLDNVQWADTATRGVIPMLVERLNGRHVWLLGAGRKAELRQFSATSGMVTLPLSKLSTRFLADLFRHSLAGWPVEDAVLFRWARLCRGVPLFVVEMSAHLLRSKDPATVQTLEDQELFPESLLGLILERLYAADIDWPTARAIAAKGRVTMKELLAWDLHGNPSTTRSAVERLTRVGLVENSMIGATQALSFTNGMVRSAIWHTLPFGDRKL